VPFVQLTVAGFLTCFAGIVVALSSSRAPSQYRRRVFNVGRGLMVAGVALCAVALIVLFAETS